MMSQSLFDSLSILISLLLLILFIRYRARKMAEEAKRNRALFGERFTRHGRSGPPDVSLLTLAERQLSDWEQLLLEMETSRAPIEQIRYCRQQVERFRKEVAWLREQ